MDRPRQIVLTPPGLHDPSIAIAAARAGALGVVDLEYVATARISHVFAALSRLRSGGAGIRVATSGGAIVDLLRDGLPAAIETIVVVASVHEELSDILARLRELGQRVLVEVRSGAEAEAAESRGADGLVARGQEAGGWVGEETTFILLQRLLARGTLPVWAHGGIGVHTAAASAAAGAAGVVLDVQLSLTRESTLPGAVRAAIARMDGSETSCIGDELGEPFRVYARPGLDVLDELRSIAARLAEDPRPRAERIAAWRDAVGARVGWDDAARRVWPIGQDAAFAAGLARRFGTVGGVLAALERAVRAHLAAARRLRPLDEEAPLARSHGTRYPVLQGPMTRVSDVPAFAAAVSHGGGLPFLALALMRAPEVRTVLERTSRELGDRPWGVGILGFVPLELREEQLEVVREYRPRYALIAGGRPDQALALEREGIATYLHVPSPGLLRLFLDAGARRFVFEGRECGGHVGPRPSFVLWNTMIDVLLEALPGEHPECHVVFAGGVHDARSAAMVSAMAAPLVERGMKVGVLLGTAYLFTSEAVATGAITPGFQTVALACRETVLLETGPGHATRCARTAFAGTFVREEHRLRAASHPPEEVREQLEALNLGRLRVASKGVRRARGDEVTGEGPLVRVGEIEQRAEGMYMLGQLAMLREQVCSIEELHRDVAVGGTARLAAPAAPAPEGSSARPCDVAIVGMECIFPKAPDLDTYWSNIVNKVDAITEIPRDRFDWRLYFDPDPKARDRIYSKWGGFLDPVPFDVARFGMPPASLASIEPVQLLVLEVVRRALDDAGYASREFDRSRTGVIVGVGGGVGDLGQRYGTRAALPMFLSDVPDEVWERLPEWTEDSFAGIIANVTAGRVANRFDLRGVNYTVDAACASSLAALYAGVRELETRSADTMIVAAADTVQNPFGYLCFSKTRALSASGRCRAFDDAADGTVISEGIGVVVLKRLADAERDGDRIYAVIKAVAGASDGRGLSMTAPSPDGQILALERAYGAAGVSPATVELIEAHGTGTVAGDHAELESLSRVFGAVAGGRQWCAVGSVKSMIGHTKCAAGLAGLIKVAKAVYHRVLPPSLGVERPNTRVRLDESPFYVNTEARPWLRPNGHPRRAGVSSFGFGGANFHATVEEYTERLPAEAASPTLAVWPAELVLLTGATREAVRVALDSLAARLGARPERPLRHVAAEAWDAARAGHSGERSVTLALVATSVGDLQARIDAARARLTEGASTLDDPSGIYFAEAPLAREGGVAVLFPGQGSQYPGMLADLALHFGEVAACFERASEVLADRFAKPLAGYVFPRPSFSEQEEEDAARALTDTRVAQPALGAAGLGVLRLLATLGVAPDAVAGHSYGEYVALCAAGVLDEETLYAISAARGRAIVEGMGEEPGTMAAVQASREQVSAALAGAAEVWIANVNAPKQTVISGTRAGVAAAQGRLEAAGLAVRGVPVACAFHSPLVQPAAGRFADVLARVALVPPRVSVYSNTLAAPLPTDPDAIRTVLARHLVEPVAFADELLAMHAAGVRVFIEVGPRNVLTGLVQWTLADLPVLAVATDVRGRSGIVQLLHALGQLAAHGVPVSLDRLFVGRAVEAAAAELRPSQTTWLVSGGGVRPLDARGSGPVPPTRSPAVVAPPAARRAVVPPPVPPSVPDGALPAGAADDVVLQFQRTMERFLEVQRTVMLSYLGGTAGPQERVDSTLDAVLDAARPAAVAPAPEAPAAPPPVPEPQADASVPVTLDAASLEATLLRIASDRTGYPTDLLDLDARMEADLGIDSIKRVEILGALQEALPPDTAARVAGSVEALTKAKTLRALVEQILLCEAAPAAAEPVRDATWTDVAEKQAGRAEAGSEEDLVPRFALTVVERPMSRGALRVPDGVVLVTDDGRGVALAVTGALRRAGGQVVLLGSTEHPVALAVLDDVARVVERVRAAHGRIGGIVHLAPLAPAIDADVTARMACDVKGLFHLARAAGPDIVAVPDGLMLAAVGLGGTFGCEGLARVPGEAGVLGLMKTIAVEWAATRCRVVDVEPELAVDVIADRIVHELADGDDEVEVGWQGSRRLVPRVRRAPREDGTPSVLDADAVVLVTGGARGITSEVVEELGRRYRPRLVLVGRQPLPGPESPSTADVRGARELRAILVGELRRNGDKPPPAQVEAAYRQLLRDREVRTRMEAIRATGASVEYRVVDVRDAAAFAALVEDVYRVHGRIHGVIHGAGLIEDRLLLDKTGESFDRVFDTKVSGALALARALRPESLRFLVLFSSVAGRWGNRGQCDYAAANEVLAKLARYLDARWPGRVVAAEWGPWSGSGMVSEEVARQFLERGVRLVGRRAGARSCLWEIEAAAKGTGEIVLGGGPWEESDASTNGHHAVANGTTDPTPPRVFPLLARAQVRVAPGGAVEMTRTLDLAHDLYLDDHRIDGRPVLPAAVVVEMMAELVQHAWPEWRVVGLTGFRVQHGVVLRDGGVRLRLRARAETHAPSGALQVDVELFEDEAARSSYRATVDLAQEEADCDAAEPVAPAALRPFPADPEVLYRDWLFHGPRLRCIRDVAGIADDAIVGWLHTSRPSACLRGASDAGWLIDPVLLDGGLQLALLWTRATFDMTALPASFRLFRRFGAAPGGLVRCELRVKPGSTGHLSRFDVTFSTAEGRVVAVVRDLESSASRELNRLVKHGDRIPTLPLAGVDPAADPERVFLETQIMRGIERGD